MLKVHAALYEGCPTALFWALYEAGSILGNFNTLASIYVARIPDGTRIMEVVASPTPVRPPRDVQEAVDGLQKLTYAQKLMLAAMQLSIWIGLASLSESCMHENRLKINIITFTVHAAQVAVLGEEEDEDEADEEEEDDEEDSQIKPVPSALRELARRIPDRLWEPLCTEARGGADLVPVDPLTLISLLSIRLILQVLSADGELRMQHLITRTKQHPLYARITEVIQAAPMFCKRSKKWIPHGYERLCAVHAPKLADFKRIFRQPYVFLGEDEFRNQLGVFSILPLDAFQSGELEGILTMVMAKRATDQTQKAKLQQQQRAVGSSAYMAVENNDGVGEDARMEEGGASADISSGLTADQAHAAALISQIRQLFESTEGGKHFSNLLCMQRRFADLVSARQREPRAITWDSDAVFIGRLREAPVQPSVSFLMERLAPFWHDIHALDGMNTTNQLLFRALHVGLASNDKRKDAFDLFVSAWTDAMALDPPHTDWAEYAQWGLKGLKVAGFLLFF